MIDNNVSSLPFGEITGLTLQATVSDPDLYYEVELDNPVTVSSGDSVAFSLNKTIDEIEDQSSVDFYAVDVESGTFTGIDMNYFGARYYDAAIGLWSSVDPAMEFWNLYSYCGGDPVNY